MSAVGKQYQLNELVKTLLEIIHSLLKLFNRSISFDSLSKYIWVFEIRNGNLF